MTWVVGVDEAGYGPNLGPLAQSAVAVRVPVDDVAGWATLAPWLRRHAEKDKTRLLVDDSKLVHQGKYGFAKLEAVARGLFGLQPGALADFFNPILTTGVADDLAAEAWFAPQMPVPLFPDAPAQDLRPRLDAAGLGVRVVGLNLVPAPVFNRVVAGSGTKGAVLSAGFVTLLQRVFAHLPATDPDDVLIVADQHGGRVVYGHLLAAAFPTGTVERELETLHESRYRVSRLARPVRVEVRSEADAGCVAVALASCLAKYAREVCMRQFNAYWQRHLPSLRPTAGYPLDAKRFYAEIQPTLAHLGLTEAAVWRCR